MPLLTHVLGKSEAPAADHLDAEFLADLALDRANERFANSDMPARKSPQSAFATALTMEEGDRTLRIQKGGCHTNTDMIDAGATF